MEATLSLTNNLPYLGSNPKNFGKKIQSSTEPLRLKRRDQKTTEKLNIFEGFQKQPLMTPAKLRAGGTTQGRKEKKNSISKKIRETKKMYIYIFSAMANGSP